MERKIIDEVLHIDGYSSLKLVEEFGTPLYIFSEKAILKRIQELKADFLDKYVNVRAAYAAKAFCTTGMCRICKDTGLGIDVVSGGELYTALKAGILPENIEFNGNNKTYKELALAVEHKIGRIIVDNPHEFALLKSICKEKKTALKILFRINPGVDADTHEYIITGKRDGKFGMDPESKGFLNLIKQALKSEHVDFIGLHMHIGSQIFEKEAYLKAVDIMLDTVEKIHRDSGFETKEINLGGGFGANYTVEARKKFSYYLEPIMKKIDGHFKANNKKRPAVVIEPGRSIVAEAGLTLYEIGAIKKIDGIRTYMSVDGGMSDNIRPALYGAKYLGMVVNRGCETSDMEVRVVGKFCESGDVLIDNIKVPRTTQPGDVFAVFSTGAYGYSMASNYNRSPIPPVILIREEGPELMVKRQSYEQLVENDQGNAIKFAKFHGAGNDFIIINNMEERMSEKELSAFAKEICERKFSVGADGLIAVEKAERGGDFKMLFYNSDGSLAEMCGNGARCLAKYGFERGLAKEDMKIETTAGFVDAWRIDDTRYKVKLNDLTDVELNARLEVGGANYKYLYGELGKPGVPHVAVSMNLSGFENFDNQEERQEELRDLAKIFRYHEAFKKGANVNFYDITGEDQIKLLTFERGVEDFTLACGTGAGATAALLNARGDMEKSEIKIMTPGGKLEVSLNKKSDGNVEIFLTGPAVHVFDGQRQYSEREK